MDQDFLDRHFEYHYCPADDHVEVEVMGKPFAKCLHPFPDDMSENEIQVRLFKRWSNQGKGLTLDADLTPQ